MIESIIAAAQKGKDTFQQQQLLREQLQHLILQEMDRMGLFTEICFVGGTALRILHQLNRFSEDLDFSAHHKHYNDETKKRMIVSLHTLSQKIQALGAEMKPLNIKSKGAVLSTFFSFPSLLSHMNPRGFPKRQLVSIKVEIDLNPPHGGKSETSIVSGERIYRIHHYTLSSLFSGKLHALLFRQYTKGRDLYDFFWYTTKNISANRLLLENAIAQTQKTKPDLTNASLQTLLIKRAEEYGFAQAQSEMKRFLLDPRETELLTKENFLSQIPRVSLVDEG